MNRLAAHLCFSGCVALFVSPALYAQQPAKPAPKSQSSASGGPGRRDKIINPLNDLLDEAKKALDRNDFAAAIPPLQKFLAEKDDFAYAHFQLAYAYTGLRRFEEARPEYERAIALDPKMTEAQLNLGILLLEKDPAAAVTPLSKAVELLPTQSRPRYLLGTAQERSGDLKSAEQSYEAAFRLDPKDTESALRLAHLYVKENRPADAEPKFRAVLEVQPDLDEAQLGLAQSLEAQKKPEAAEVYAAYLKKHPEDPAAKSRAVHTLMDQQQYDAALAELDRQQAGAPPTLDYLKLRADIQIAQKKWDDSAVTLKQAVALAPKDPVLRGGLGRVYMQLHNYTAAEPELKAAILLDPGNVAYWKDLSSTFYLAGNYPGTLAALDAASKLEAPNAGTWFLRALCYDKLQQIQPALDSYQKFLELDRDKNPDQVWQAQQRSIVLKKMLEKKR